LAAGSCHHQRPIAAAIATAFEPLRDGKTAMKTLARADDKIEVLRRLRTLRPDSVARWGRMSAHQMVCHLSDSCRMAAGAKQVSHSSSLSKRTIVKWVALYLPLAWPAGVVTRPEIDQEAGGTCPVDFAADLDRLEQLLELTTTISAASPRVHPIFGPMSHAAWLRWGYLHADHHLRQFGK
jgi:hypothetical protein